MSSIDKDYNHFDMNGVNLQIGDTVIFTYNNSTSIYTGKVTGFNKRFVVVDKYRNHQPFTLFKIS